MVVDSFSLVLHGSKALYFISQKPDPLTTQPCAGFSFQLMGGETHLINLFSGMHVIDLNIQL